MNMIVLIYLQIKAEHLGEDNMIIIMTTTESSTGVTGMHAGGPHKIHMREENPGGDIIHHPPRKTIGIDQVSHGQTIHTILTLSTHPSIIGGHQGTSNQA